MSESGPMIELVIGPEEDLQAPVSLETLRNLVDVLNDHLAGLRVMPRLEFGRGEERCVLYLRHPEGQTERRSLTGPRGRQGRRGRNGPMPRHQWSPDRRRVRFEIEPGVWGEWSADLTTGEP